MPRLPLDPAPDNRTSLTEALGQAVMLYQRGDLAGSRRLLKLVLRKQPQHFDALHLMGLVEAQRGHNKDAEKLIRQAIRINPQSPDAHSNHGNVLRALGEFETAVASYDAALSIKPAYPNALNNRAIALMALGRFADALSSYDRSLALDARSPNAHYNRGIALAQMQRPAEALDSFDRALALEPQFIVAHVDRGNALVQLGRLDDAVAAYDQHLRLNPKSPHALFNRGLALSRAGRPEDALASFERTLTLDPGFPGAHDSRGNVLLAMGRHDDALASFEVAARADPGSAATLNNRGFALQKLRRFEAAIESFNAALAIDPGFAGALNNRANALIALGRAEEARHSFDRAIAIDPASADLRANRATAAMAAKHYAAAIADFEHVLAADPDYPYALGNLLHCKMHECDWASYGDLMARVAAGLRAGKRIILPVGLLSLTDSPEDQLRAAKIWIEDLRLPRPRHPRERQQRDRLRVAYVSADLWSHPAAMLTVELIERHDREKFEIIAISFGPDDKSELRARLMRAFDQFHDVTDRSDAAIASLIEDLGIDIAIDLTGFTDNCRPGILALRPAPIQVSYLGYCASMGVDHIDYIIADATVIPAAQQEFYSERMAYLPDTFLVNDTTTPISSASPGRAEFGLPEQGFVFCSFNNVNKITPEIFDVWMRPLRAIEGSVLWLGGGSAAAIANLRREAQARGVAGERLVAASRVPALADHLARHRHADLFLDTLHHNAVSTAAAALWAGLPVLTLAGHTFTSRIAASLLNAIGLPELVTDSLQDYEAMALQLARDPARLAAIRERLARNRSTFPLFDTGRFRRNIEAAFTTMWERHSRGEPPASFAVPPSP